MHSHSFPPLTLHEHLIPCADTSSCHQLRREYSLGFTVVLPSKLARLTRAAATPRRGQDARCDRSPLDRRRAHIRALASKSPRHASVPLMQIGRVIACQPGQNVSGRSGAAYAKSSSGHNGLRISTRCSLRISPLSSRSFVPRPMKVSSQSAAAPTNLLTC